MSAGINALVEEFQELPLDEQEYVAEIITNAGCARNPRIQNSEARIQNTKDTILLFWLLNPGFWILIKIIDISVQIDIFLFFVTENLGILNAHDKGFLSPP